MNACWSGTNHSSQFRYEKSQAVFNDNDLYLDIANNSAIVLGTLIAQ